MRDNPIKGSTVPPIRVEVPTDLGKALPCVASALQTAAYREVTNALIETNSGNRNGAALQNGAILGRKW